MPVLGVRLEQCLFTAYHEAGMEVEANLYQARTTRTIARRPGGETAPYPTHEG